TAAARSGLTRAKMRLATTIEYQAQAALRAAELFRCTGSRCWLFRALLSAARSFSWIGDRAGAEMALREAQDLLEPSWPLWLSAHLEHARGRCDLCTAR